MIAFALASAILADPGRDAAQSIADALGALKKVSFTYQRIVDYADPKYHHELTAQMFIDLGNKAKPVGCIFIGQGDGWTTAFDGLVLNNWGGKHPPAAHLKPDLDEFQSLWVTKNSIIGLRKCLIALVDDKSQNFELRAPNQLKISIDKRELASAGLIDVQYNPIYTIEFDPSTKQLSKITHELANRDDTIVTTFTKWNLDAQPPAKDLWRPKGS